MAQSAVPQAYARGCDTNNALKRVIGKSNISYKTMRGYKITAGMMNGIVADTANMGRVRYGHGDVLGA